MALKLTYYGQNDSVNCTPAVPLTGEPAVDQATLTAAGYLGGKIMALIGIDTTGYTHNTSTYTVGPANEPAFGALGNIIPCDTSSTAGNVPFATLLNGPGEAAGAIGPSGSKKAPVVRALWQGNVDYQAYSSADLTFKIGQYVYCGGGGFAGLYVSTPTPAAPNSIPVGICTHVPFAGEPWLGVASLL